MARPKLTEAEIVLQGGNRLAAMAKRALTASGFVRADGMCQMWARQVIEAVHGDRFAEFRGATAHEAMEKWDKSKWARLPRDGSQIGDILYKAGKPGQRAGHVGIRIAGNRVAENSSVHAGGGDARGVRSLADFGTVSLIVRLPRT